MTDAPFGKLLPFAKKVVGADGSRQLSPAEIKAGIEQMAHERALRRAKVLAQDALGKSVADEWEEERDGITRAQQGGEEEAFQESSGGPAGGSVVDSETGSRESRWHTPWADKDGEKEVEDPLGPWWGPKGF